MSAEVKHTPGPSVHETNIRAVSLGLSFAQMNALQWFSDHSPAYRVAWRGAYINTGTLNSLYMRGLIVAHGAGAYRISEEGRAAIAKAIGSAS